MAKSKPRIAVPISPDELIALAKRILNKHTADGGASPLAALENLADFTRKLEVADAKNEASKELRRQAEKATQDRDNVLGQTGLLRTDTVRFHVTAARDLLLGIKKGREQSLGDWGFVVDSSPRVDPEAVAARKAAKTALAKAG